MRFTCIVSALVVSAAHVEASTVTNGPNGINSTSLNILGLDGSGVTVGQVEDIRPGDPALDLPANHNDFVDPAQVRIQDDLGNPQPNMNIDGGHRSPASFESRAVAILSTRKKPNMSVIILACSPRPLDFRCNRSCQIGLEGRPPKGAWLMAMA